MRIPVRALIHSCVLRKYRTSPDLVTRTRVSDTALSRVRIVPEARVKCDERHCRTMRGGKLYFDTVNSLPEEAEFITEGLDSVIVFGGHEYPVTGAAYIYDGMGLHHTELSLGGAL